MGVDGSSVNVQRHSAVTLRSLESLNSNPLKSGETFRKWENGLRAVESFPDDWIDRWGNHSSAVLSPTMRDCKLTLAPGAGAGVSVTVYLGPTEVSVTVDPHGGVASTLSSNEDESPGTQYNCGLVEAPVVRTRNELIVPGIVTVVPVTVSGGSGFQSERKCCGT